MEDYALSKKEREENKMWFLLGIAAVVFIISGIGKGTL
jgi:hypothetical protein